MGRDSVRRRRTQAGLRRQRRRTDRLVQEESGLLQMSAPHLVCRNSEDLDRQVAKVQVAGDGQGDVRRKSVHAITLLRVRLKRKCPARSRAMIVTSPPAQAAQRLSLNSENLVDERVLP